MENPTPLPAPESPRPDSADSSKTLDQDSSSPSSYDSAPSLFAADLLDDSEPTDEKEEGFQLVDYPKEDDYQPVILDSNGDSSFWRSDWRPALKPVDTSVVGAGFSNLGNTCFLNAVLQCFIHTVPLLDGVVSNAHFANCRCNNLRFCLLCAMRDLVEMSLNSKEGFVAPYRLVDNLNYFSSSFQRYQQEDAHEFLQCFLDRLESCSAAKQRNNLTSETENLVKQVFGGRLLSKLKCSSCGHCSDTYEPSIDLSLEIENADSLVKALESFTKVEKIDDSETKFTCEECKEQVSIEKQLLLDQVPSVASFHLKRFKTEGITVQKIDRHVAYPKELDLLPFTGGNISDKELKYELYAIVVHSGLTSTSGHYYCFVRVSPDVWCKFDDSWVVEVTEDFALSQEAYILFYAKQGTSWFTSFIEAQKCLTSTVFSTSPKSVLDSVDTSSFLPAFQEKTGVESNEVSVPFKSAISGVGQGDIKYSGPNLNEPEVKESRDNMQKLSKSVEPATVSLEASPNPVRKVVSPSLLDKSTWTKEASTVQNITPQTPPRSPSPEIYREDPPDAGYSAPLPRNISNSVKRASCKRKLEEHMDDREAIQACRYIKKSVGGARGKQLLAAMGSRSEGSLSKTKSRMGDHQRRPPLRPVVTGPSR